jgi:hypothetical protein
MVLFLVCVVINEKTKCIKNIENLYKGTNYRLQQRIEEAAIANRG